MAFDARFFHPHLLSPVALLPCLALLAACGPIEEEDEPPPVFGNLTLEQKHNYSASSSFTLPTQLVVSDAATQVCWDGLTADTLDIQCQELGGPADILSVNLLGFESTSSEVQAQLASGKADTERVYRHKVAANETCTTLNQFESLNAPGTFLDPGVDFAVGSAGSYLLVFQSSTTPGIRTRTMTFVQPSADAAALSTIQAPQSCVTGNEFLHFSATLSSTPLAVPAQGPWEIDWLSVAKNGAGSDTQFTYIDGYLLGFFENATVEYLQENFLFIRSLATELYLGPTSLTAALDLSLAKAEDGTAFSGFYRTDGLWLLAVLCDECANPAPQIVALLDPQ